MLIVPKASVRTDLTIAILVTVVLSWIISSGIANYFNYLGVVSFRQEMISHPDIYRTPIPEPRFGIREFLMGRPPFPRVQREPGFAGPPDRLPAPSPGPPGRLAPPMPPRFGPPGQPGPPPGLARPPMQGPPPRDISEPNGLLLRLGVALALAILAGAWLGRKFTQPLSQLAKGADAFQSGQFGYRIPAGGTNEFAAVAAAMNEMASRVSDQITRLEEEAQRRRQFLADAAHELRSPVTTMATMAGALKDGLAEEPTRRDFAVSALVSTSERLGRLVQDLMELARVDLTELPLNISRVNLHELIASAIGSHEAAASAAGIVLHPLASTIPVIAMADRDRTAQVLDNVIGNAISYAGEGSEISVKLEDGDPIHITISDTGKGISAKDLPYVLDTFYRADSARTPDDCHSGLGLSIANRLIEAHGGKLCIASEEGRGTVVTVELPKRV